MTATTEWLETDGLGGFASGPVEGRRTRRYHALLNVATSPPTGRFVLVNGVEVTVAVDGNALELEAIPLESFSPEPWPTWTRRLPSGARLRTELVVVHGQPQVVLRWLLLEPRAGVVLSVRPLLTGRDHHALHHRNDAFRFDANVAGDRVRWQPYADVPAVVALSNGRWREDPLWRTGVRYAVETERGYDDTEDVASPGVFTFSLENEALLTFSTIAEPRAPDVALAQERQRRAAFPTAPDRAADAYLVRRGTGRTIVAGYPWFTDWGRDTFISLRGLCLATGRFDDARAILLEWSRTISEGMVPNRFTDHGEAPEYNSVDASLWYVVAVGAFLHHFPSDSSRPALGDAVTKVLEGYARGTRFGIRAEGDGLLACGVPGVALTWMDARVDGRAITPRVGKPVEIQALWFNALTIGAAFDDRFGDLAVRVRETFAGRFWDESRGCLHDVVDADHLPGRVDSSLRPNQLLAVGGLPLPLLDGLRARRVVELVEEKLWTPMGLRTLAPAAPGYAGRYEGGLVARDEAYHQGTVWPWLLGPFVEAWVRVRGDTDDARHEARRRFLDPLRERLDETGHVPEIADGDAPHRPRGCPFQAWSVGELIRIDREILQIRG